jgi:hypothetical protein
MSNQTRPTSRTVLVAKRATLIHVRCSVLTVQGGDVIDDPEVVSSLQGSGEFQSVEVADTESYEKWKSKRAERLAKLRKEAAELGHVVHPATTRERCSVVEV